MRLDIVKESLIEGEEEYILPYLLLRHKLFDWWLLIEVTSLIQDLWNTSIL